MTELPEEGGQEVRQSTPMTWTNQGPALKIRFSQTGDAWHDWGLCELYDLFSRFDWPAGTETIARVDDAGFWLTSRLSISEFASVVYAEITSSSRWNELHPRFPEGKAIEECFPRHLPNGRRIPGEKYDSKITKEGWQAAGLKGDPPAAIRNRCQRLASIPMTPAKLADLMSVEGGKDSLRQLFQDLVGSVTSAVTQSANPLVAKHHSNAKVRGPSATNSNPDQSAAYMLACYAASLSVWKPFVKSDDCVLLLPDNLPFERAMRLWKHLRHSVLVSPDGPNGEMRRNIPLRGDGEEANLLILLDGLLSTLALRTASEGLFDQDIVQLNDWQAIHFSSGTNVSVGVIHRIQVPGSIFDLLIPIPCPDYWHEKHDVSFISNCLAGIRIENLTIQSLIAKALFNANKRAAWETLVITMFLLYKNVDQAGKSNRSNVRLLPHFLNHFAKELLDMQEDQLAACRRIGELAGRAFSKDVTLISRLHNTTSPEDLRTNLNLLAFRLFKASGDRDISAWHVSPQEFQKVLDTDDWQAAAQTISIFASVSAFNSNLDKGQKS